MRLVYRTSRTMFFICMFAMVCTRLGAYLTTRLAYPFMFVAHAFPWFTTVSPRAELVVKLAQSFTFVAPVSLKVKLAQALTFVTSFFTTAESVY